MPNNETGIICLAGRIAPNLLFRLLVMMPLFYPGILFCQDGTDFPDFHPIAEHSYDIKSGLPDMYITNVLEDSSGRIHILKNGTGRTAFSGILYRYDGTKSLPSEFDVPHKFTSLVAETVPNENYYGYYFHENEGRKESCFFTYDPLKGKSYSVTISDAEREGYIQSVVHAEGGYFILVLFEEKQECRIFKVSSGEKKLVSAFQLDSSHLTWRARIGVTRDYFWISGNSGLVFRISRSDNSVKKYQLFSESKRVYWTGFHSYPTNHLWVSNGKETEWWDPKRDTFFRNLYRPGGWTDGETENAQVFKDNRGNFLIRYRHIGNDQSATLVDRHGQVYDFSSAMSGHNGITGSDFKQKLIFFDPGLRFVDVSNRVGINKIMTERGTRGMVEIDSHTFRVLTGEDNIEVRTEGGKWIAEKKTPPCMEDAFIDSDILKDPSGNIWFTSAPKKPLKPTLKRYHPSGMACRSFDPGFPIERFDLDEGGRLILATPDSLYLWKEGTGPPAPVCALPSSGGINQVFSGKDGLVWLATDQGLLRIEVRSKVARLIDLFAGIKTTILCIHQDADGRLWLGTTLHGLIIYDPLSGNIRIIDQSSGLSNNTVVSILQDDDGDLWVGTFHGISILSEEGEVIGKLYEEDGLAGNECNRWSSLKMQNRQLCFGAVKGFTIIDPELWKHPAEGYSPPKIYLTGLQTEASASESFLQKDLFNFYRNKESIVLPARNRNLKATFVLSNYASPEKSTFAYQIRGMGERWNYLGSNRQLSLNALPAGHYDIVIKGTDGRGRWSDPPILISIRVRKFFYQQWWFFLLCAVPFFVFFMLWQHRLRGERQRLEAEVQNRTATIRQQAEKLKEMDRAKSILYTNITHEFRTPLTVISGMAEMINEIPGKAREIIDRNSRGLLRLVNQILDLAKLESGHLKTEMIQADIVPYIRYLTESFQSLSARKHIKLTFHSEIEKLTMDFDEKKLEMIISNLLSNAVKFSNESGNINLNLDKKGDRLLIKVTDEGIGIPEELLPFIFDRFYQAEDEKAGHDLRYRTGSGIGLTLTKELVELMDGDITVMSTPGEGSVFKVSLPVRNIAPFIMPDTFNHEQINISKPIQKEKSGLKTSNDDLPLLLIIEDNLDVATYIRACLQDHYKIDLAENGAAGIEMALTTVPDIIISDVMMPEKDGYEVCDILKNDTRTSHIPIILLTAKADMDSRLEGLSSGADAYLAKPFNKEELLIRLRQLIELRRKLQKRYAIQANLPETVNENGPPSLEDIFLQKIRHHVEEHLGDSDFGNIQLARKMHLSQSQLFRKLKALTGESIAIHIRSIRLQEARKMILNSDMTIAEIAYSTGFTDPSYFTRTFSKQFGIPPSEIRK